MYMLTLVVIDYEYHGCLLATYAHAWEGTVLHEVTALFLIPLVV